MKARRIFQVITSILLFLLFIALLGVAVLTLLPTFGVQLLDIEFFNTLVMGIGMTIVTELTFLVDLGEWAPRIFIAAVFVLPAILLLIAGIILASRSRKHKQGKYIFAEILALLGLGIFTAVTMMYAKYLFKEDEQTLWMACIAGNVAMPIIFMVLSWVCKSKKKAAKKAAATDAAEAPVAAAPAAETTPIAAEAPAAPQAEPAAEAAPVAEPAEAKPVVVEPVSIKDVPTVEPVAIKDIPTVEPIVTEPVPQMEQPAPMATVKPETVQPIKTEPAPAEQPKQDIPLWEQYFAAHKADAHAKEDIEEYIPDERKRSVSDIVQNTYRKKTENISDANFRKIRTLRSLLDSNTISKDEYIAVVDKYLQEEKNEKE